MKVGGRTARNAEPVDPAIRTTHLGRSIVKCGSLIGQRLYEPRQKAGHMVHLNDRMELAPTGNHPQFPEISLSPITPVKMRPMQSTLIGAAESPSTIIPRIAVPAAPMPVQTA